MEIHVVPDALWVYPECGFLPIEELPNHDWQYGAYRIHCGGGSLSMDSRAGAWGTHNRHSHMDDIIPPYNSPSV
ncbi:hypothetical protein [Paenibacillus swuensis]|uniref:hypothetical protein n=1 Tax=Paenibacillus swuensis TaxID=1178515 RepID=UPI0018D3505F|nr:hypothetical protein [Paenibacillus swuensis]